jgi:predicted ATPase
VLKQAPTACALAAAAADASFPARAVAEFVQRWGFFDPNPFLLRRDWSGSDFSTFDPYGRNLAETLHMLKEAAPDVFERIVGATQDILGLPTAIEPRVTDDRFYFVQNEPGLRYQVHQMGVSSGTLRMLALMTALFATFDVNLIGIEEPENYVHPTAIASFLEYLRSAQDRVQFLVTTHSPLLLDYLGDPAAVRIVQRTEDGTTVVPEQRDADGIRRALEQSGFGLGAFYESEGFGAN